MIVIHGKHIYLFIFYCLFFLNLNLTFFLLSSCQSGTWICTTNVCKKTCSVYGIGHYETFDGHAYSLKGENSYVLIEVSYGIFFELISKNRLSRITISTN